MNIFKKISNAIKSFLWLKDCATPEELMAYIPVGHYDKLAYWIDNKIYYVPDKSIKESWESVEVTLKRKEGDCEEMCCTFSTVVETWPNHKSGVYAVFFKDSNKNHAICIFRCHSIYVYGYDRKLYNFKLGTPYDQIVKSIRKDAIGYVECNKKGYRIGPEVLI